MAGRFCDRLLPAPIGGGFAMDGYWVRCGSVVRADDGHTSLQPRLERPQLLFDGSRPSHLFMATGEGPIEPGRGDRNTMRRSWNMVIPLA